MTWPSPPHPLPGALRSSLAAPVARAGEVYSYVDDDGVIHISNVPAERPVQEGPAASTPAAGLYASRAAAPRRAAAPPPAAAQARVLHRATSARRPGKYQLPEALILAVMAVESNFDPRAISDKGAMGLMQLMPGTARELYVADAWDPAQNIEGGARYLRLLANQYSGDIIKTLAAYNAGPEAVRRAGEAVPNIPETQEYVRKVVALYQAYKAGR